MKVRLFWIMMLSFFLVIVLGIGGMIFFFRMAIADIWESDTFQEEMRQRQEANAAFLADYYALHGNSWEGVNERLLRSSSMRSDYSGIAVVDTGGSIVATTTRRWHMGQRVDERMLHQGVPIMLDNEQIGTMFVWDWGDDSQFTHSHEREHERETEFNAYDGPPPQFVRTFLIGFISAGVGLAVILLVLAILSAGNLSRPLHHVTTAAETMAAGNLNVQVPGSHVRELDQLAMAFNRMAQALAESDHLRRQMTADIAHDLRTPLAIIKGRLEGVQDGVYEATPDQIERLLHETAMLERLIEDLRVLALAEAGQLPLYLEEENPRDVLDDTAMAFADQAREQEIALSVEAPDNLPLIAIDVQRMSQVLGNLLTNALRYTPAGGVVVLEGAYQSGKSSDVPGQVVLCVRDTGQGIAEEDVPHIFSRFWRADRSRTRSSGGSGLGLAIARQIVVAHGGTIEAQSAPGQGTTMCITLPCAVGDTKYG